MGNMVDSFIEQIVERIEELEKKVEDATASNSFSGIVYDNNDPEYLGRIRVSIIDFGGQLTDWIPSDNASIGGIEGELELNVPKKGAIVWIHFRKGDKEYPYYTHGQIFKNKIPEILLANYPYTRGFHTSEGLYVIYDGVREKVKMGSSKSGDFLEVSTEKLNSEDGNISEIRLEGHNGSKIEIIQNNDTPQKDFIRLIDENGDKIEIDVANKILNLYADNGYTKVVRNRDMSYCKNKTIQVQEKETKIVTTKSVEVLQNREIIVGTDKAIDGDTITGNNKEVYNYNSDVEVKGKEKRIIKDKEETISNNFIENVGKIKKTTVQEGWSIIVKKGGANIRAKNINLIGERGVSGGIVTSKTICPYTGVGHTDASEEVFATK